MKLKTMKQLRVVKWRKSTKKDKENLWGYVSLIFIVILLIIHSNLIEILFFVILIYFVLYIKIPYYKYYDIKERKK